MVTPNHVTMEQSGAFVETFMLAPTGSGSLNGLTFAIKDIIDVAGSRTGCGNPDWRESHPIPTVHAVVVEQLLQAGATAIGKTVTDELAFSLLGENFHYGTPLNPKAPDRVPGGSSSGSASAVACGLADFALGTDTGGSVRIPASNCGLWGFRPTHGRVSVAGVMPFSPGYDTVGVFTRTPDVLAKAAGVLLACDSSTDEPANVYLVQDAFRLADADVQAALAEPVNRLKARYGNRVTEVTLEAIIGDPAAANHMTWNETYCVIQWAEVESVLGGWIADRKPRFGPISAANFQLPRSLDRRRVPAVIGRRERYAQRLNAFLGPRDLLCMPTAPAVAPRKNSGLRRDAGPEGYFPRTLGLTALSGVGRLPQVSIPGAEVGGVPIGLSLLAASGNDGFLLGVATRSG